MELCDRFHIPHSLFLGAGDGRWTETDRVKALAFEAYRTSVCDQCGTRAAEWDEEHGGDRYAYVTTTVRCVGCELITAEQDQVPDGADGYGVRIGLVPRAEWEKQERSS
ncbi:hypothetical protein ACQPZG_20315 [Streptomyces sp. CA-294286]|uniref:hypothetical protein n=1 Tax=Streptomyces sp. CA-294286 TaxID=3240070 RepID=UPI003D94824F